jgi:hypothetical protein
VARPFASAPLRCQVLTPEHKSQLEQSRLDQYYGNRGNKAAWGGFRVWSPQKSGQSRRGAHDLESPAERQATRPCRVKLLYKNNTTSEVKLMGLWVVQRVRSKAKGHVGGSGAQELARQASNKMRLSRTISSTSATRRRPCGRRKAFGVSCSGSPTACALPSSPSVVLHLGQARGHDATAPVSAVGSSQQDGADRTHYERGQDRPVANGGFDDHEAFASSKGSA